MPATQKIFGLARPRDGVQWSDMTPLMQIEAAYVWSLYEHDVLREAWVRTDALGAVYVLEATPEEAAPLLADQPMARAASSTLSWCRSGRSRRCRCCLAPSRTPWLRHARPSLGRARRECWRSTGSENQ